MKQGSQFFCGAYIVSYIVSYFATAFRVHFGEQFGFPFCEEKVSQSIRI
jgi:hypothetical protein